MMPPPEHWPAGSAPANLLAKARLAFAEYDRSFHAWREKKLRDTFGAKRVHPIPVLLYPGETEEEYEAAFIASLRRVGPDGTVRDKPDCGERPGVMQCAAARIGMRGKVMRPEFAEVHRCFAFIGTGCECRTAPRL